MSAHSKDRLQFDFKTGVRSDGGEKIRHIFFTDARVGGDDLRVVRGRAAARPCRRRRDEGGVHAGQRDEFGQEFFRARHAPTA